jgi:hypothetical protein
MEKKLRKCLSNGYVQLILAVFTIFGANISIYILNIGDIRLILEITLALVVVVLAAYIMNEKKKRQLVKPYQEPVIGRIGQTFLDGPQRILSVQKNKVEFVLGRDKTHFLKRADCSYGLSFSDSKTGDMTVKKHFQGINAGNESSIFFTSFAGGDNSITNKQFLASLKANDSDGNELSVQLIEEHSSDRFKPFKVNFFSPIEKGKPFDIELEYAWPGCISRSPDGIILGITCFEKGVEELSMTFSSPIKFKNFKMNRLVFAKGIKTTSIEGVCQPTFSRVGDRFVYFCTINKPKDDHFFEFEY